MIPIESPNELPHGLHKMIMCQSAEAAEKIRKGRTAYLFKSKILTAYYLFVPVVESEE